MKNVRCTVITQPTLEALKHEVGEFTDMDLSYFDKQPTARTFTHYQTEEGGIEYVTLLDGEGRVLNHDVVVGCICGPVEVNVH